MHRCAASPASASLRIPNRSQKLSQPECSASLSPGLLRACRTRARQARVGCRAPHTRLRRRPSRLHPESARPARSSFSQRQHPGSGQHFSQRRSSSRWNGQSSQSLHGFASRKPRDRSPRIRRTMFFLQLRPPRRDRSFHAQTRDRLPASFGFRIWPRKCNRRATVEICARFRCNLRVERLCS